MIKTHVNSLTNALMHLRREKKVFKYINNLICLLEKPLNKAKAIINNEIIN